MTCFIVIEFFRYDAGVFWKTSGAMIFAYATFNVAQYAELMWLFLQWTFSQFYC